MTTTNRFLTNTELPYEFKKRWRMLDRNPLPNKRSKRTFTPFAATEYYNAEDVIDKLKRMYGVRYNCFISFKPVWRGGREIMYSCKTRFSVDIGEHNVTEI